MLHLGQTPRMREVFMASSSGGGGTDRRDGDQQRTEPHAARERRQRDEYEEGDAGVRGVEASRLPQREAVRDKQPTRHPHESMEQSDGTRAPR